jgi:hypothetical protein
MDFREFFGPRQPREEIRGLLGESLRIQDQRCNASTRANDSDEERLEYLRKTITEAIPGAEATLASWPHGHRIKVKKNVLGLRTLSSEFLVRNDDLTENRFSELIAVDLDHFIEEFFVNEHILEQNEAPNEALRNALRDWFNIHYNRDHARIQDYVEGGYNSHLRMDSVYRDCTGILAPSDHGCSGVIAENDKLQERCRTCINRNKDFDKQVAPEHLKDLKCAINPSYAMSGVGECADFIEDSAPVSEPIAELPQLSSGDRSSPSLINLLTDAIRTIPSVRRVDLDGYRSPNGWEYRLKVTKNTGKFKHFILGPHGLNPDTFPAMVNGITASILEGDRPSLSPFTVHPWNRIQVSGDCPISTSRAEEYLAPSCSARSFIYRKWPHTPMFAADCDIIEYEEITVPIEIIKLKLDGRSSGFCAKKIAGDGWSMIGPAFLVGGDWR